MFSVYRTLNVVILVFSRTFRVVTRLRRPNNGSSDRYLVVVEVDHLPLDAFSEIFLLLKFEDVLKMKIVRLNLQWHIDISEVKNFLRKH